MGAPVVALMQAVGKHPASAPRLHPIGISGSCARRFICRLTLLRCRPSIFTRLLNVYTAATNVVHPRLLNVDQRRRGLMPTLKVVAVRFRYSVIASSNRNMAAAQVSKKGNNAPGSVSLKWISAPAAQARGAERELEVSAAAQKKLETLSSQGTRNGSRKGASPMTSETHLLSELRMKHGTGRGRGMADLSRPGWLAAVSTARSVGVVATCVPFIASMSPSERAQAFGALVEVDVADFKPGELHTVAWRGKPVCLLMRTPSMLDALRGHDALLVDPQSDRREQKPEYARNEFGSVRSDIAVMVVLCTHLGFIPSFRPEPGAVDIGASWPGGFYCPCHGSRFDFSGRVFKNVPAPRNLEVPPHHYIGASVLPIGEDPPSTCPERETSNP